LISITRLPLYPLFTLLLLLLGAGGGCAAA
jgi:hypothetical protein